jgi:hypothetical protein
MYIDKEFGFVWLSDGLPDERSEKLALAIVGADLEFVCQQTTLEGGYV